MTRGSSLHVHDHLDSEGEDDVQAQAALTRNESPSSAVPVPMRVSEEEEFDLEHGAEEESTPLIHDGPSPPNSRSGWRNLASLSLSALSGEAAWRQAQADRNR